MATELPLLAKSVNDDKDGDQEIDWKAWFNILCTMAGTGILQLPYTLKQGGWVCILLICAVAVMTNTTGKWLIKCLYKEDGSRLRSYPDIGEAAYGRAGRIIVQIFHKATLLGVTAIFLILTGKFLLEGIGGGGEGLLRDSFSNDAPAWQTRWTLVAAAIVLIPTVLLRTINEIAPLAAFGMIASSLCVLEVVVFAVIFRPITPGTVSEYNLPVPPTFNVTHQGNAPVTHHVLSYADFPTAFAAITLSFGGHAVFPSIEEHMPHPKQFNKAFNFAYVTLLLMYLATACFGYYAFGSVTYTPILCNFPRDNVSAMGLTTATTKLLIAFHVMSAYPILMNVFAREIETGSDLDAEGKGVWRLLLRTFLVTTTCLVAIYVPYFGDMMQLVGAMCLTMIVFVLPVIFSWKLWGESMSLMQKTYGLFIIFVGAAGGFVGSIQAILAISKKLQEGATQ